MMKNAIVVTRVNSRARLSWQTATANPNVHVKLQPHNLRRLEERAVDIGKNILRKVLPARERRRQDWQASDKPENRPFTSILSLPNELTAAIIGYLDIRGLCAVRLTTKNMRDNSQKHFEAAFETVGLYMAKEGLRSLLQFTNYSQLAMVVKSLVIVDWRLCRPTTIYHCLHQALLRLPNCKIIVLQSKLGFNYKFTYFTVQFGMLACESVRSMIRPRKLEDRAHILPQVISATHNTSVKEFHYASPAASNQYICSIDTISLKSLRRMMLPASQTGFDLDKLSISMDDAPEEMLALSGLISKLPRLSSLILDVNKLVIPRVFRIDCRRFDPVLDAIRCPFLETLVLYTCNKMAGSVLANLLRRHSGTLKHISLGHICFQEQSDAPVVLRYLQKMPKLTRITLDHLSNVSDDDTETGIVLYSGPPDFDLWTSRPGGDLLNAFAQEAYIDVDHCSPANLQQDYACILKGIKTVFERPEGFIFEDLTTRFWHVDNPEEVHY